MDAIVTAGGIPQPGDKLYDYTKGESKAMLDMAGKPMIQWVLDALSDAKNVDNVIIIGLSPKSKVTCKKPVYFLSNQGRMLTNIVVGVDKILELNKKAEYAIIVSSDIPAVTGKQIDWLIETCMETHDDLYYGVCPREVMEARYPESKRTYTKLKDIQVCGADMNITHVRMATEHLDMWEELIGNRKNPIRQAAAIGLDVFFQVLTQSITLDDLVAKVTKRLGIKGRAIVWNEAEPCMDVDKPHQLEIMRADMEARVSRSKSVEKKSAAKSAAKKAPAQAAPAKKKPAAKSKRK
jgi:GTP:adenosylcobinamide-phosphate guanylyltransferase